MSSKSEGENIQTGDKPDKKTVATSGKKIFMTVADIKSLSRDEIAARYSEIEKYIASLDEKSGGSSASELDEKLKLQQQESTRRENVLVMRLATKEQEMQELVAQIHELKQAQTPATSQLKSTLLDPSVNLLFEKMKTELGETKEKLEQAQNDLSAWKFTPDSVTGKKLMAKCRMLIAENQDLGKQLSQGRIAQLEAELALQKKYNEELKCSQDELNDFVLQLDEEVEGMESTICALQQQLKETKQKHQSAVEENEQLTKILERTKDSQHDLKRTHEASGNDSSDVEMKRSKNLLKVIESPTFAEDHDEVRTHTHVEGNIRMIGKSPIKTNNKNPFSMSSILSTDEKKASDNGPQSGADEAYDVTRTRKLHGKEGTNGEMYDS